MVNLNLFYNTLSTMKATEFCYWLQGYFELHGDIGAEGLSKRQVDLIQSHLALVFKHDIDPQAGPPQHQQVLNNIHGGKEQFRC